MVDLKTYLYYVRYRESSPPVRQLPITDLIPFLTQYRTVCTTILFNYTELTYLCTYLPTLSVNWRMSELFPLILTFKTSVMTTRREEYR